MANNNKLSSHWPISITNGVAALFNLFLPLALVRILPPDQVGRYKIFFLYVMLSPGLFMTGGLSNGLYHWSGRYPDTKQNIQQSWTWLLGIAILAASLGLIVSPFLAPLLKMPLRDLEIFICYAPFGLACVFIEDLMISRGQIWKGSLYGSGFQVLRAGAALAAAYWGRRVEYVLWAFFGVTILRAFVGWALVKASGDLKLVFSRPKSKEILRYAFPVSIAALSGMALSNVDQLILSFRLHPAEFAFYAMGCLTVPPLQILEMSVNRVLIPQLSKAFGARQYKAAASMFSEGVSELFRFLLPATVGLIVFSEPIIRILFTDRYIAAAQYLQFYALFYLFMCIPYDAVARAMGDGMWIMRLALVLAPFSIITTWFAATHWGAMGALLAFLFTQMTLRVYALTHQKRRLNIPYSQFLPLKEMVHLTGWVLLIAIGVWLTRPAFSDERFWFAYMGPLFTLVYFAGAYGFILKPANPSAGSIPILLLTQYLSVGGLEKVVYVLSRGLRENARLHPFVGMYDRLNGDGSDSLVPEFEKSGISVFPWQKPAGFSPRLVIQLVRVIFSKNIRIVHAHDLGPLIYGGLAKCFSMGRVKLVFTLHTLLHVNHGPRYRMYFKYFLRLADRIVAVSPAIKEGLVALGIEPQRIHIIPNGVAFTSPAATRESKIALRRKLLPHANKAMYARRWVLSLARFHAGKGQDLALEMWKALSHDAKSGIALFLVGPHTQKDYAQRISRKIEELGSEAAIVVLGPTHHPEEWLQASDIFFSGSAHEGMPLAPLEAVGSGLHVLLSDIPGHNFLKPWSRYFPLTSPTDAARQLEGILSIFAAQDEKSIFEANFQAAQSLRSTWSESSMVASYEDVFLSLWETPELIDQRMPLLHPSSERR